MSRHAVRKTTAQMVRQAEVMLEATRLRKAISDIEDQLTLLEKVNEVVRTAKLTATPDAAAGH